MNDVNSGAISGAIRANRDLIVTKEKGFSGPEAATGKRPRNRREHGSLRELQKKS